MTVMASELNRKKGKLRRRLWSERYLFLMLFPGLLFFIVFREAVHRFYSFGNYISGVWSDSHHIDVNHGLLYEYLKTGSNH